MTIDNSQLRALLASLDVSPSQLRAATTGLGASAPPVRTLWAQCAYLADPWVLERGWQIDRILDGMPASSDPGPGGRPLAGVGDLAWDEISPDVLDHLVRQIHHRVGTARLARAQRTGKALTSYQAKDWGTGAARSAGEVARSMFALMERHHRLGHDPAHQMRATFARRVPSCLSDAELARFETALGRRQNAEFDRMVFALLLATGAREKAVLNLRLSQLDPITCMVSLQPKAGSGFYRVPVRRTLILRLLAHARSHGARSLHDHVLISPYRQAHGAPITGRYFDRVADVLADVQLGPERFHPHRFRHTAITQVQLATDLRTASKFADHAASSAGTHGRYITPMTDQELRTALEAVWGPFDDCGSPSDDMLPPWTAGPRGTR